MDEHQVVQVSHQFKDGVTFMDLSMQHLLNNIARGDNCNFETQGHFYRAFNWCNKDFALIAFRMNSMGAHYNPVSISIVDSESTTSLEWSYNAASAGLYAIYNTERLCGNERCGFCTQFKEQIEAKNGTFKNWFASEDATNLFFPLDKPSCNDPIHLYSWAKEKFGADTKVLQCRHHLSFKFLCHFTVSGPTLSL
jgi:hypothetical protein